jgi:hypothetical protein
MELFFDDLFFDDRSQDDLFAGVNSRQPYYADIIKRWAMGNKVSDNELSIVTSILIYYPEYVLKNGHVEEFIELIRNFLQQPGSIIQSNPEKGLLLYNLFFLLLKLGKREESVTILDNLEKLFSNLSQNNNMADNTQQSISDTDLVKKSSLPGYSMSPDCLENSYIEIITCIMNESGILSLKPGFNISQLPGPFKKLSGQEGHNLRNQALIHYGNKEYVKASAIYRKMMVYKFELPGTFTHLARLEMSMWNRIQAEIYIINAWRIRDKAPMYVLARILYFVIFLNILRSEKIEIWLGCLKSVINQRDSKMDWEMDCLLNQYEKEVLPQHICLLRGLLEVVSGKDDDIKLNEFEIWRDASPIVFKEWPDFNIVF